MTASSLARREMSRKRTQAEKQHVAVSQPDAVVMMVRMAQLPEDAAVPIGFERDAPLSTVAG